MHLYALKPHIQIILIKETKVRLVASSHCDRSDYHATVNRKWIMRKHSYELLSEHQSKPVHLALFIWQMKRPMQQEFNFSFMKLPVK